MKLSMPIKSPCGQCERRGCGPYHDQCEKFKEYQKAVKKKRADRDKYYIKHPGNKNITKNREV